MKFFVSSTVEYFFQLEIIIFNLCIFVGPEIWEQTEEKVDAVIMATGTGGTLSGSSIFLKSKNPNIKCYVAETVGSGVKWVKVKNSLSTLNFQLGR